jgi:TonB family protein
MTPAVQERRRYTRQLISPRLYVPLNGASSGGILSDVSEGGMALDILGPVPASDELLLDLDLPEIAAHFEVKGKVAWVREHRVGVKFVDLPDTSHRQIKQWLAKKAGSAGSLQNVVLRDRATVKVIETTAPPSISHKEVPPKMEGKLAGVTTPAVRDESERAVAPIGINALQGIERAVAIGVEKNGKETIPSKPGDRLADGLRTSFAQSVAPSDQAPPPKIKPERVPIDREMLYRWVSAAVVVFLLIVSLAFARWIYISPRLDKMALPAGIRDLMGGLFGRAPAPDKSETKEPAARNNSNGTKAERHVPRGAKTPSDSGKDGTSAHPQSPATKQFEVKDAQNGRQLFPPVPTVPLPLQKSGIATPQVSGGQTASGSLMQEAGGTKVGSVSLNPAADIPETKVLPEYPAVALKNNIQGRVVVKAVISKDGTLKNVQLAGPPSILSGPVLEAVKQWRYQPRTRNGVAVEVDTQITIDFSINAT